MACAFNGLQPPFKETKIKKGGPRVWFRLARVLQRRSCICLFLVSPPRAASNATAHLRSSTGSTHDCVVSPCSRVAREHFSLSTLRWALARTSARLMVFASSLSFGGGLVGACSWRSRSVLCSEEAVATFFFDATFKEQSCVSL